VLLSKQMVVIVDGESRQQSTEDSRRCRRRQGNWRVSSPEQNKKASELIRNGYFDPGDSHANSSPSPWFDLLRDGPPYL